MGFGRDLKQLKNPVVWKKSFKQSGGALETAGYTGVAVGTATGQPELVALGGSAIAVGKAYKGIAQGIKLAEGKKISPQKKQELKRDVLSIAKGSY